MDHDAPGTDDPDDADDLGDPDGAAVDAEAAFDRELAAYRARTVAAFLDGSPSVGPHSADPASLLLVETRDVVTGGTRSTLLFHVADAGDLVVFGPPRTSQKPTWYEDLQAHPHATARRWEHRRLTRFEVVARPVTGTDAEALFPAVTRAQPAWEEYGSGQSFPLVRLERLHPAGPTDVAPPEPLLRRLFGRRARATQL